MRTRHHWFRELKIAEPNIVSAYFVRGSLRFAFITLFAAAG